MGWDIDRFPEGEVNLELICCICTCILEDPVESPCRHVFCSQCIKTWLSNQKSCPSCRAPVFKKDLQPVVHILRNMINKQRIYCDNRERGCEELTPLENLASHVASCLYSLVSCSNEGCGIKVMRKDHKAHSEICLKRTVMCDHGCEMFLTLGEKQSHNCIRSLKTHFQDTTNELLSRVSRLEELFNIMVTKPQTYEYNTALIPKTSSSTALGHSSKEAIVCSPYSIPSPPHVGSQRYTLPDVEIAIENPVNLTGYGSDSVDSVESGFLVRYEGRDASPAFDTMRMRGRASERLRLEQPIARHRSRSPFRAVSGQVAARFNLDRDRLTRTSPAYPVNIDDNHHRRTDDESSSDTFSSTTSSSESDTD